MSVPFAKYRDITSIDQSLRNYTRTDYHDMQGQKSIQVKIRFSFNYGKKLDMIDESEALKTQITGVQ